MIKLTCPSCGGSLELPDQNGVYHCMYCGTKILIDQTPAEHDSQRIRQLKELCRTALEMKNYAELKDFANRMLELNIKEGEAWMMKGIATFYCNPEKDASFYEAVGYLKKAYRLLPDPAEVVQWRTAISADYALQKNMLGLDEFNTARAIFDGNNRLFEPDVVLQIEKHFTRAMNYYLLAAKFSPANPAILNNLCICEKISRQTGVVNRWPEEVGQMTLLQKKYEEKLAAEAMMGNLSKRAGELEDQLKALKQNRNVLSGYQQRKLEEDLAAVRAQMKAAEKLLKFEFPALSMDW